MAYSFNGTSHLEQDLLTDNTHSSSIDTTGCDLLVVTVASFNNGAGFTLTDAKSNTWTLIRATNSNGQMYMSTYYSVNPTVGSGHWWNLVAGATWVIAVAGFTGSDLSTPKDLDNGASGVFVDTLATGSITPTADNELIWSSCQYDRSGGWAPDSGMTLIGKSGESSSSPFITSAYKIQTAAAAINVTWTANFTGNIRVNAHIVSFKAAAASGLPAARITKTNQAIPRSYRY